MGHVVKIKKSKVGRNVVKMGKDSIPHVTFVPLFNHFS